MRRNALAAALCVAVQRVDAIFDTFYAVDVQPVVCPVIPEPAKLPPGMVAGQWPTSQEYAVQVDYTAKMNMNEPHVVTFLRPQGGGNVSITFVVNDAEGRVVAESQTVTLEQRGQRVSENCECNGVNVGLDTSKYGDDYGRFCNTWDADSCDFLYPDLDVHGPWCCASWCYVDASCKDAYSSSLLPDTFFSYGGACPEATNPPKSNCEFTEIPDPCECINVGMEPEWSAADNTTFGSDYGAMCKTWDFDKCLERYGADVDYWCCSSWCWVGSTCSSAIASTVWPGLYWSDDKCADTPKFVNQCPYKAQKKAASAEELAACACVNATPASINMGRSSANLTEFPADYGGLCGAWDAGKCAGYFPQEEHGIWCCQTFCYVDEDCPSANPSIIEPGWFWSYDVCQENYTALANCAESDACQPTGNNSLLSAADKTKYGNNYGASCGVWDSLSQNTCKDWYSLTTPDANTDYDWCCEAWAYVKEDCPGAVASSVVTGLFYSAEACTLQQPAASSYNFGTGLCEVPSGSRRLSGRRRATRSSSTARRRAPPPRRRADTRRRAPPPAATPAPPPPPKDVSRRRAPAAAATNVEGRRRAPASAPARRRAPVPPPVDSNPRRRARAAPSPPTPAPTPAPTTPRRRAVPPRRRVETNTRRRAATTNSNGVPSNPPRRRVTNPRRRGQEPRRRRSTTPPRRRTVTVPASIPPNRRRAPVVVSGTPRRRVVTGGAVYSAAPRRRQIGTEAPRRRVSYGYDGREGMYNNYAGTMPSHTPYGYSGQGPARNSKINVVMAGAAGLAVGAAVGVGSYYVYQQYAATESEGNHRRRSFSGTYADQSWCEAPGTHGKLIQCKECYQAYGSECISESKCFDGGCDYALGEDTDRNDVFTAGFIPAEFTPPLTITVQQITGDNFRQADICPSTSASSGATTFDSTWQSAKSVKVNLFVTLTQVEAIDDQTAVAYGPGGGQYDPNARLPGGAASSGTFTTAGFLPFVLILIAAVRLLR